MSDCYYCGAPLICEECGKADPPDTSASIAKRAIARAEAAEKRAEEAEAVVERAAEDAQGRRDLRADLTAAEAESARLRETLKEIEAYGLKYQDRTQHFKAIALQARAVLSPESGEGG